MDTKSDVGWVQCQPCVQCYHHSQPIFDPTHSSSYTEIACNSVVYNLLQKKDCQVGHCLFEVTYGDGYYSKGNLAFENLAFREVLIRKFAFGCAHIEMVNFVGKTRIMDLVLRQLVSSGSEITSLFNHSKYIGCIK